METRKDGEGGTYHIGQMPLDVRNIKARVFCERGRKEGGRERECVFESWGTNVFPPSKLSSLYPYLSTAAMDGTCASGKGGGGKSTVCALDCLEDGVCVSVCVCVWVCMCVGVGVCVCILTTHIVLELCRSVLARNTERERNFEPNDNVTLFKPRLGLRFLSSKKCCHFSG